MLNNIGLPGLIISLSPMLIAIVMGIYSLAKVPNSDDNYNYAGFWLRLVAAVIDAIIITLITLIPALLVGYMIGVNMADTAPSYEIEATAEAVGNLLGFVVGWLYYALMESSKYQATLGKKLLGLRVVDVDSTRIGFGKATGRYFGRILSFLTLFIGYFMAGWTRKKQGLHDKLSGCLVVKNSSPVFLADSSPAVPSSRAEPTLNARSVGEDGFEAEALRRYKAGEIDEETMLKLLNSISR